MQVSSTSESVLESDVIQAIKHGVENLRFNDRNVGLVGRLQFVTEFEFTYIYSTVDMNFPFFSYDPVVAKALTEKGFEVLAYRSELIQFLGGSFLPKASECHIDYIECTLNKGILTLPLPDVGTRDVVEETVLRATRAYMRSRTDNDISMLTYQTPELEDPTMNPSIAPSTIPSNAPIQKPMITLTFDYAFESSSRRLLDSLSVYLAPTIKHVNTEILVFLSSHVDVAGMTSNLFKGTIYHGNVFFF